MIRHILLAIATLTLGQLTMYGQFSITYSGTSGESNVVNSLGTAINGDTVSIGTFAPGFDPTNNASNISALQANWESFDSTTTRNLLGIDGRFSKTSAAVNNAAFDHQQIFLFITETSGSTVTEYGLFTSSSADWVFPAHDTSIPPNPISTDEVNVFLFGDGISSGSPGSVTPGSLQTSVPVVVPEPGSLSLLAVGLVIGRVLYRRKV